MRKSKRVMRARDVHDIALAVSLLWMFAAFSAASWAAGEGLVTLPAALLQWLAAGVLPPALAMASLPPE